MEVSELGQVDWHVSLKWRQISMYRLYQTVEAQSHLLIVDPMHMKVFPFEPMLLLTAISMVANV